MSTTTTYTMTELRAEPQHGSLWPSYGSPVPMQTTGRFHEAGGASPAVTASVGSTPQSHLGRPRSRQQSTHPLDYGQAPPPPPPPSHYHRSQHDDGGDGTYDRYQPHHHAHHHAQPPLMSIPSIHSLKRNYTSMDQSAAPPPAYTEMVQDLRDEFGKSSQDQKLLAFKKAGAKHAIVDAKGRMQDIEIEAQLHGMFFLSELSSTGDGNVLGAELTCYRRNLFQISGNITFPYSPLSVVTESGEPSQIKNMELSISATESVDGNAVRLIVIPWKTPPPNSPDVAQVPDQEPPPLPLIACQETMGAMPEDSVGNEYAVHPIGWRRLQFRIATANNGRRKELQQHFLVHLKLHGTLANGSRVVLQEMDTSPIVVRGRSPRNFQARKEIPLLGSSAGSRGQTLVETGHGIIAQAYLLNKPPWQSRPKMPSLELPRSSFGFGGPKAMPPSPIAMRSNSYPTWTSSMAHNSVPAYADPYPKLPLSGAPTFSNEPHDIHTSMPSVQLSLAAPDHQQAPIRTQYATYVSEPSAPALPQLSSLATGHHHGHQHDGHGPSSLSVPRYVDASGGSNPRPSKSPRHDSQASVHSASSLSNDPGSAEYRYGPPAYAVHSGHGGDISPHTVPASAPLLPPPQQLHQQQQQQQQQQLPSLTPAPPSSHNSLPDPSAAPSRDYYSSTSQQQSWAATTLAADAQPVASYSSTSADGLRPYASYGSAGGVKSESQLPPPQSYTGQAISHYAWNTS